MKKLFWIFALALLALAGFAKDKTIRKSVFVIVDGVPADVLERVNTPAIDSIAKTGGYHRSIMGGDVGKVTETPTISAVCYNSILTSTWSNKHNVWNNDIKDPNYNYPTIFKVLKDINPNAKIGVFSGWEENRTLLVGDDAIGTGRLHVDYFFHDSDKNTERYPSDDTMRIFKLDQDVVDCAARCIIDEGPDVSWIYLWYMDDSGHRYGNGERFDQDLQMVDKQISQIWSAVKSREAKTGEEWLTIITTDHGRTEDGYGHGGQSERERTTWVAMDRPGNKHFNAERYVLCTDIMPTICNFMKMRVSVKIAREWEGVPMVGKVDFSDFKATRDGDNVSFSWNGYSKNEVIIRVSITDNTKTGELSGKDRWVVIGRRNAMEGQYEWNCSGYPSEFYKFYMESPNTVEGTWIR